MLFKRFRIGGKPRSHESTRWAFKGYFLMYDCPFCRKPQNIDGYGQSILWIALDCISKGSALSSCDNCGKFFKIPPDIFAMGVLEKIEEIAQRPDDVLFQYIESNYVASQTQDQMLRPDWYDLLLKANKDGPINARTMPWDSEGNCPLCGNPPDSYAKTYSFSCPQCKNKLSFDQDDVDQKIGVQVKCCNCGRMIHVPSNVWCSKCYRGLLGYYDILRNIAVANRVGMEQLRIK